ncbi:hypothetical protein [Nonomuraea sp. NPDC049141]|uniref:hypothetical protein n=1 Tax=Nonomuraea sp. NPDC049141 TaxID=3155500 RepID=UPI0033D472A1
MTVERAAKSDFVLVNLFREPIGAPMPPDAVNALVEAAGRREPQATASPVGVRQ